MPKILFLTSTLDGGVGRVIKTVSGSISAAGGSVRIFELPFVEEKNFWIQRFFFKVLSWLVAHIQRNEDKALVYKYRARNYAKITNLRAFLKTQGNCVVISFLNQPIFLSLFSVKKGQKLIISERNDPAQFIGTKTTMAFIRELYPKAYMMVCQSPDAKKWYDENSKVNSVVISNPVKPNLPESFSGTRQKKIVNFCRISTQKNLTLLVDSFAKLSLDYTDYDLYIYGDAVGNGVEGYIEEVMAEIETCGVSDKVHICPGDPYIHSKILDYAMFVSSSDYEGMSNSMLEAMAIGLPTICTDCPAGGARAVIKDHENGLLVPVGDADALYRAMKEVIENSELAEKLSRNGVKIRETQSVDKIVDQWLEVING